MNRFRSLLSISSLHRYSKEPAAEYMFVSELTSYMLETYVSVYREVDNSVFWQYRVVRPGINGGQGESMVPPHTRWPGIIHVIWCERDASACMRRHQAFALAPVSFGVNDHKVLRKHGNNDQMTWMIPGSTVWRRRAPRC